MLSITRQEALMPTRSHLVTVARKLKQQLNGRAFLTIERTKVTELLREVSGEPGTRIKSTLAADLTSALVTQGIQVYPSLGETTTGDTVRLYHAGSVLGQLIDTIVHPDPGTDADLGDVLTKVKGKWKWAPVEGPATASTEAI
jgi:hypothetical protein